MSVVTCVSTYDPFDLKMSEQPTMSCCVSTVLPDGQTKGRRLLTELRRTEQNKTKIKGKISNEVTSFNQKNHQMVDV